MSNYTELKKLMPMTPRTWLITGVAGFIGSNLLEALLSMDQKVIGLDNFSTGHRRNLSNVQVSLSKEQWARFNFIEGDICNQEDCKMACKKVDHVLHQAALGSVPRSLEDPIATNQSNIVGFLNMLVAARDAAVTSFTYAASSSTYGDHPDLPKKEDHIGNPLSPYAVTKYVNEIYADVFARSFNFYSIGLRYFNVFGKRQDPDGAYAAVIPKWISAMINNEDVFINGNGKTSRDFCFIENAVQANIKAALSAFDAKNKVYNVAVGDRTSLNQLFQFMKAALKKSDISYCKEPMYRDFRPGDVMHSQADISKARKFLSYEPTHNVEQGLEESIGWYLDQVTNQKS